MTRHFPNHIFEKLTARDAKCSAIFPGRDSPKLDRVFHESGPVAHFEQAGSRSAPLCCIHCGRIFDGDFSGQVTDKTLTGAA